ncbi:MAG TPA: flagellar hook-length control protein FliK [Gammaproteobacteria bacterium]
MIEMLQQPKIQPGNVSKNTPKVDHGNNNSHASGKSDSSFDQHLNEQIQRSPAKEQQSVASKKTFENQSAEETQELESTAETSETGQIAQTDTADETNPDIDAKALELGMVDVAPGTSEETLVSDTDPLLTEQILPLDGNELPPEPVAGILNPAETTQQKQGNIMTPAASPVAKSVKEAILPQQGVAAVARQVAGPEQAIEQSMLADEVLEFKTPEMKMQVAQQNVSATEGSAKLNALFASVAATASANQQVPVTTGVTPLHMLNAQAPTNSTGFFSMPGFSASIPAPVQQHGAWAQGLSDQMAIMVQGKLQTAEMKLNPAHLGPMEIKLSMQDDKASVTFVTQHAAVREALDVAMPRLREMFESQGLNLANVDVSQYSEQNGKPSDEMAGSTGNGLAEQNAADVQDDSLAHESIVHINGHSGLSLYA